MTQPSNVIQFPRTPKSKLCLIDVAAVNNILNAGDLAWTCGCGHPLFFLTKENGIVCQACGQIQVWGPDQ